MRRPSSCGKTWRTWTPSHPARGEGSGTEVAVGGRCGRTAADCGWAGVVEVEAWWDDRDRRRSHGLGCRGTAAPAPKELKDSIILANFVNQTGDPVFDNTLSQALRIDLEQSPVINIVSQEHLRQSVKFLGKPEDTLVTPAIAREIGEREGMKAILTGTIGSLGKQYVIGSRRRTRRPAMRSRVSRRPLPTRRMCWAPWGRQRRRCARSWARTWPASRN